MPTTSSTLWTKLVDKEWKNGKSPIQIGAMLADKTYSSEDVLSGYKRLADKVEKELPKDIAWVDVAFIWSDTFEAMRRNCPNMTILNSRTGRCVKLNGKIGKELLNAYDRENKQKPIKTEDIEFPQRRLRRRRLASTRAFETRKPTINQSNTSDNNNQSRKNSLTIENKVQSRKNSLTIEDKIQSRKNSLTNEDKIQSRKNSLINEDKIQSRIPEKDLLTIENTLPANTGSKNRRRSRTSRFLQLPSTSENESESDDDGFSDAREASIEDDELERLRSLSADDITLFVSPRVPSRILSDAEIQQFCKSVSVKVKEEGGAIHKIVSYTSAILRTLTRMDNEVCVSLIIMCLQLVLASLDDGTNSVINDMAQFIRPIFDLKALSYQTVIGENILLYVNRTWNAQPYAKGISRAHGWNYIIFLIIRALNYILANTLYKN